MGVLGSLKLKLLKPSAHHSITPLTHRRSISWPCERIPTSSNSMITRKWNYKGQSFSPSAIAQPLTTSSESYQENKSSEDGMKQDEEKFNWFEEWYPVAPEYELDKGVPHAFKVLGLDVVVWWDKREHEWRVFEDSCPHRRAPLSEGRIDGNGDLQCSYHGWCFGSRGECKHIPQAPSDGPPVHTSKRACTGVYPSLLQQGIIWFWPNTNTEPDIALNKTPPFIPMLSNPSSQSSLTMRDLPYGYEILIENLMDPSHIPYAHRGLLVEALRFPIFFNKMARRAGKPLDFRVLNLDISGFKGHREMGPATFIAPCIFLMENLLSPSTKGNSHTRSREEKKSYDILFFSVPVAPGRCRIISSRNFDTSVLVPKWITHIRWNLILDSDTYFLHLEERILRKYEKGKWEKTCYVPTKADAFPIAFRKWLKRYSNGGIPWGERINDTLPPTPPKEQLMERYKSHVMRCRSCRGALKALRALEIITQILPILCVVILGVNTSNKHISSSLHVCNALLVGTALASCLISRWLSHFIYKTFYFHDYNHAIVK